MSAEPAPALPVCPECGSDDIHAVEVRGVYDGALLWACQGCGCAWPRFASGRLRDLGEKYARSLGRRDDR